MYAYILLVADAQAGRLGAHQKRSRDPLLVLLVPLSGKARGLGVFQYGFRSTRRLRFPFFLIHRTGSLSLLSNGTGGHGPIIAFWGISVLLSST